MGTLLYLFASLLCLLYSQNGLSSEGTCDEGVVFEKAIDVTSAVMTQSISLHAHEIVLLWAHWSSLDLQPIGPAIQFR